MNIAAVAKPAPRNFNLMVVGQIISILGSSLLRFALSLYILDTTGRADIYATLYAVSSIPLLLSPLGGAITDKYNRRNLMVMIDLANTGIVAFLFIFMYTGNSSIFLIGLVMTLLSNVSSAETPTSSACIPLLVEKSRIESANGIVSGVQALGGVAAPVLGGVLYGILGINKLIVLSGLAFLFAAIMEMFIEIPFTKRPHERKMLPTIVWDLKEGFAYVWATKFIRKSAVLAALLNLFLTPIIIVGVPIILRNTMGSTDKMYGIGMGLINVASILGALSIGVFTKKLSIKKIYRWVFAMAVLLIPMAVSIMPAILNLGYFPSFIIFFICCVPLAMAATIISIYLISMVQKTTPNENLGKIMAIIMTISQCVASIGMMIYGGLFEILKSRVYLAMLCGGLGVGVLAISAYKMFKNEEEVV